MLWLDPLVDLQHSHRVLLGGKDRLNMLCGTRREACWSEKSVDKEYDKGIPSGTEHGNLLSNWTVLRMVANH